MPVLSIVTLAVAPPDGFRFTVVWKLPLLFWLPLVIDCWLPVVAGLLVEPWLSILSPSDCEPLVPDVVLPVLLELPDVLELPLDEPVLDVILFDMLPEDDSSFMPDVAPCVLLVAVLLEVPPELSTTWPLGPIAAEPTLVCVVLSAGREVVSFMAPLPLVPFWLLEPPAMV